jgi:hypothetical protein
VGALPLSARFSRRNIAAPALVTGVTAFGADVALGTAAGTALGAGRRRGRGGRDQGREGDRFALAAAHRRAGAASPEAHSLLAGLPATDPRRLLSSSAIRRLVPG